MGLLDINPLVSIIIPVYNGSNYMREAIDSALAQTYKNIEVLVINDGSQDNGATREIALSYGNRIHYIEKENGGVSTALNLGIANMKGEYFSWLSHDDVYYPNKVEAEVDAINSCDIETPIVYSGWDALIMPQRKCIPFKGSVMWDNLPRSILETGVFVPMFGLVSGCSLLIPRSLLLEFGGFDERYRCIQDYKLWFDMFRGKRLVYVANRLIQSRYHAAQVGNTSPLVSTESKLLYNYMANEVESSDLFGSSVELYQVLSFYALLCTMNGYPLAAELALKRLAELAQPDMLSEMIDKFKDKYCLQAGNCTYLYCMGRNGIALLKWFKMMGIHVRGIADASVTLHGRSFDEYICESVHEIPTGAKLIVTKSNSSDVVDFLNQSGFQSVTSFDEMFLDLLNTPIYVEYATEYFR